MHSHFVAQKHMINGSRDPVGVAKKGLEFRHFATSRQEKEKMLDEVWNAVAQRSKTQSQQAPCTSGRGVEANCNVAILLAHTLSCRQSWL